MKKTVTVMLTLVMLVFCLTSCQTKPVGDTGSAVLETKGSLTDDYLTPVKDKSDAIRISLEQEELTQSDMNKKSEELRALWDEALNQLLDEAQKVLSEAELEQLTAEQNAWAADMTTAIEAAGKQYEGGSLYPLVVNSEAAKLTEERVFKLYELLK